MMSNATRSRGCSLVLLCTAMLLGCTEDLESITEITKNRVIAARFVPGDDNARAWPQLGEEAKVEWTVVDEGQARELTYAMAVCAKSPFGTNPTCAAAPFSVQTRSEPSSDDPRIRFTVPADLGESREVLVVGLICADGLASIEPETQDANCEALTGSQAEPVGTPVVFALPIENVAANGTNSRPVFGEDFISFSLGEVTRSWLAPETIGVPGSACADLAETTALPRVTQAPGKELLIGFKSPESNFERYEEEGAALQESVTVSAFSTAGKLDRSLSSLTAQEPSSDVKWAPPRADDDKAVDVTDAGALVVFYFVSRDGRAGADVTERHLCVVP